MTKLNAITQKSAFLGALVDKIVPPDMSVADFDSDRCAVTSAQFKIR